MRVEKIGHSCIVVEDGGTRVMLDPGAYTDAQKDVVGLDAILLTHIHSDHVDVPSVAVVHDKNPDARVITHAEVGAALDEAGIPWREIRPGETVTVGATTVEAFDAQHHAIHPEVPRVVNRGYLIGGRLFHPGDSYFKPPVPVEILAAPFAAPWGTIGASLDYVIDVAPKHCFPIHDGMLRIYGPYHHLPEELLPKRGIGWQPLEAGDSAEY